MATPTDPFAEFDGHIRSTQELTDLVGTPPAKVVDKVLLELDDLCCDFIARSPFCLVATAHADGHIDISPKGDPAGFVRVIDSKRLAIPDRPGNRRFDSFRNLVGNPSIGLLFLMPGQGGTLRIRGTARIVSDRALCESMAMNGNVPALALVVHIEEAFVHCPKCVIRSQLWEPESWISDEATPDLVQMMIRHANLDMQPDQFFAEVQQEGIGDLY